MVSQGSSPARRGPACPTCRRPVDLTQAGHLPFCSARCKQVDLARWLGESYTVPEPRPYDVTDEAEGAFFDPDA